MPVADAEALGQSLAVVRPAPTEKHAIIPSICGIPGIPGIFTQLCEARCDS